MHILWLDQKACGDSAQTGGKAARLSRLMGQYRIPAGFCLATTAFARWQKQNKADFPRDLKTELQKAYETLACKYNQKDPAVAVRSSAVGEDGRHISFAGIHETLLNVRGINALIEAVTRCWQSAISPEALTYRRRHQLDKAEILMAVLIQKMVQAEESIVAFGADPSADDPGLVTINACRGLGNAMMDGRITPHTLTVRKTDGHVLSETEIESPLTELQISEIVRCILELETTLGYPVDIEGAFENDAFYLLQCRPITSSELWKKPEYIPGDFGVQLDCDDAGHMWKLEAGPSTPFDQLERICYMQGFRKASRDVDWSDKTGRNAARTQTRLFVNGYRYKRQNPQKSSANTESEVIKKTTQRLAEQQTATLWPAWISGIRAHLDCLMRRDWTTAPDDELPNALLKALEIYSEYGRLHAHIVNASYPAVSRLIDWYREQFPDAPEREAYGLLQGLPNMSTEKGHRLWLLAQMATPEVMTALSKSDWTALNAPFRDAWDRYCRDFYEIDKPCVASFVCLYAKHRVPDPLIEIEKLAGERETFTKNIRKRLGEGPDRRLFEEILAMARIHYPLTEDHGYWLDLGCKAALRIVQNAFGVRLKEQGILSETEDVAFLTVDELLRWGWGEATPLHEKIKNRKAELETHKKLTPPQFLGQPPTQKPDSSGGDGDYYWGPAKPLKEEAGTLKGIGASAGVVRGRARVVKGNVADALGLQPGEILVCNEPWVTWTALFAIARALVTDVGGSLCHSAVVAREYRLPAVVGTHTATEQIRTGQMIEVDGGRGIVSLLTE